MRNEGSEPYYNSSCSFIAEHQNCFKNGRPDPDFLQWRWRPRACELPRFDPLKFLQRMRNKSWAFIGDSLSRNHVQSFLCMLSTVTFSLASFSFLFLDMLWYSKYCFLHSQKNDCSQSYNPYFLYQKWIEVSLEMKFSCQIVKCNPTLTVYVEIDMDPFCKGEVGFQ